MRKGLKEKEAYNLNKIQDKLNKVDSFKKVSLRVYKDEDPEKFYFVEAVIYVDDKVYEEMDGVRGDGSTDVAVYLWAQDVVNKKLRFCNKNSKVERVIITDFLE